MTQHLNQIDNDRQNFLKILRDAFGESDRQRRLSRHRIILWDSRPCDDSFWRMNHEREVVAHYEELYEESGRLTRGAGLLELLRTQEVLLRYLATPMLRVADIGGGPGVYARWLAAMGHQVELVDPIPRHVAEAARILDGPGSVSATLGDARSLPFEDESFDLALLLGPLYHLLDSVDRSLALREVLRILKPGGVVVIAAISRFASLCDGLVRGFLFDPEFADIVSRDLATGQHVNPSRRPGWFTSAYFHDPSELRAEVTGNGFDEVEVLGVEGPAIWMPDLDTRLSNDADRSTLLKFLRSVEAEPALFGTSSHLLATAVRPTKPM